MIRMLTCDSTTIPPLRALLARYGLRLEGVDDDAAIPGSYWGAPEAGLVVNMIYARRDTPLHSVLHESAHWVCMDDERRKNLHADAGGDYAEEDAVCFLQILLAQQLGVSPQHLCADMDAWGYTFRLGSAYAWYREDADDARAWLQRHELIEPSGVPTWKCRALQVSSL